MNRVISHQGEVQCVWNFSCWKARQCSKTSGQDQLHSLQGPVQNKNAELLVEKSLRMSGQQEPRASNHTGAFLESRGSSNTPSKLALIMGEVFWFRRASLKWLHWLIVGESEH